MKLTTENIRQMIKEELSRTINETLNISDFEKEYGREYIEGVGYIDNTYIAAQTKVLLEAYQKLLGNLQSEFSELDREMIDSTIKKIKRLKERMAMQVRKESENSYLNDEY